MPLVELILLHQAGITLGFIYLFGESAFNFLVSEHYTETEESILTTQTYNLIKVYKIRKQILLWTVYSFKSMQHKIFPLRPDIS